ncbi:MAG: hypothetical protein JWQ40_1763 [Segetibacter sp.]|nr:hypothetical protein [Segetibacter sp.]
MHPPFPVRYKKIKKENLRNRVCCKRLHQANIDVTPVEEDFMWVVRSHV